MVLNNINPNRLPKPIKMKVICINDGPLPSDEFNTTNDTSFEIKEGEPYTVIEVFLKDGYCWYVLEEDPDNNEHEQYGFDSQRFASLTDTNSAVEQCVQILHVTEPKKKWYERIFN